MLEDDNVDIGSDYPHAESTTEPEEPPGGARGVEGIGKPVVCSFMEARDVARGVKILRAAGVPNYAFPEDGVKSLAAANWWSPCKRFPTARCPPSTISTSRARTRSWPTSWERKERYLTQADCRPLLSCYNLPLLKNAVARTADDAARAAVVPRAGGDEGDVGRRDSQVRCGRSDPQRPWRRRAARPTRKCRQRGGARPRRENRGDPCGRDGPQGRGSHFGARRDPVSDR